MVQDSVGCCKDFGFSLSKIVAIGRFGAEE